MARITGTTSEKMYSINRWLGLNQCADGDTKLKIGEASEMRNFKVTRDGNLQKRPGTKTIMSLGSEPVKGLWSGLVMGNPVLLCGCEGKLYNLVNLSGKFEKREIGNIDTSVGVHIFGFNSAAYILTETEYKVWNGTTLEDVEGYVPLVAVTITPEGGGELLENINRLNGRRRVWISPDGTGVTFKLPETDIESIDYIKLIATGEIFDTDKYSSDLIAGTVTFTEPPERSTNSIEIGYTVDESFRGQVTSMRFSELYNSMQDTRVFLYGDGSNKAIYSGVDYDGIPRADYFPDLFEIAIGDSNTPITAMIRHFSSLICYKTDSTYSISYGSITLADGTLTAAFYSYPCNKAIGNKAPGQAVLVLNTPRTLDGSDVYEWRSNSKTGNLTRDERQAVRISDRITAALEGVELKNCICFDDNYNQEYWIVTPQRAIIHQYATDAWYTYTGLDIACITSHNNKVVIGSNTGTIIDMDYSYKSDDGNAIDAYWASGDMSFNADYMRKYAAILWLGLAPERKSELEITVQTDRRFTNAVKELTESVETFEDIDFSDFSFVYSVTPQVHKVKIKAKKFVFYKLVLSSNSSDTSATVLSADIKVRYTGEAK